MAHGTQTPDETGKAGKKRTDTSGAVLSGKGKNREEAESLEVAEDSRETEWSQPSFLAELFMGKLRTEQVLPYPLQEAGDRKIGDEFCAKFEKFLRENVNPDEIDETGIIPEKVMKGLAELGCFGIKIPKEYGGLGLSQTNYGRALALVSSYCASTAALLSAHQSIGVPQPLSYFGTEAQKKKYLPMFAKGAISAFALTEPEVGSDPARMSTTATPTEDGKHFLINGTKLWCTNGAIADVLIVMAQSPAIMKNGREKKQITAFIVEKGMPGFEVVHRCRFMGLNGIQNALLKFTNVKVPRENIIWGEGKGLRLALITLNTGRLSLPAGCIGGMRQCLRVARIWGAERRQWGAQIGMHEAGASKLGYIASHLFATEAITWLAAAWTDRKSNDIRLEAAVAKVFGSEHCHSVIDQTLQLRGGRGYERATSLRARGEKPWAIERALRDSRINLILEGSTEIMRLFVAREALDHHLRVAGDVLNSRLGIGKRLFAAVKAGGFYAAWYPMQWLGPFIDWSFFPRFASLGRLGAHLRYAKRASRKLARTLFHLMVLNGPALEKRQNQLMRIVAIGSDLFAMAATVGRAKALKAEGDGEVESVADLFCREARVRIESNFHALKRNEDKAERVVAKSILEGKETWLEKEIVITA